MISATLHCPSDARATSGTSVRRCRASRSSSPHNAARRLAHHSSQPRTGNVSAGLSHRHPHLALTEPLAPARNSRHLHDPKARRNRASSARRRKLPLQLSTHACQKTSAHVKRLSQNSARSSAATANTQPQSLSSSTDARRCLPRHPCKAA